MAGMYKVRNWEQFQHYKDRNPPWIKLHFALLSSEDWVTLDDASKLLAVVCMLIASRNNGMVPNNPAYLKRVAYLDRLPKLKPLIDCGFLENVQADDSALQAPDSGALADARPETETEADTEEKDPLSETSSDEQPRKALQRKYPEDFEAFWSDYPRSPNMSKSKALAGWRKLTEAERAACHRAVPAYRAFLASKADHPTMHATTFINERRFEGFAPEPPKRVDETVWQKRLTYGRSRRGWFTGQWGPAPGQVGCTVPEHLLKPDDGAGWRELEKAA
ncbi:hypothetical protein GOC54_05330 [Sinorhizobium meliloti]|nr:hypothetical protein [Sinorhizobium meliloti]